LNFVRIELQIRRIIDAKFPMSSASFQTVSDLHLETRLSYNFVLKQTAPNLAFLGDIGQVVDDGLFAFLEKQLSRYWNVIFVLGNHEPAMTSWLIAKQRVHNFADRMRNLRAQSTIGRFIFLDQTRYDIDDTVTILGCTLFSKVTEEQTATVADRLIDFKQIRQWTIEDHLNAHKSDLEWLNSQVLDISRSQPQRQIAILLITVRRWMIVQWMRSIEIVWLHLGFLPI
jgi:hypothetical protein